MSGTPLDVELVRFTFAVGIAVAIVFYDHSRLSTGSVVVPAYLALGLVAPWALVGTLLNAAATFWIVHRLLPRFFVVSRAGKFHAVLTLSVCVQLAWQHVLPEVFADLPIWLAGVGYVIPGLIAHDVNRQGAAKTLLSIGGCSALVWLALAGASVVLEDSAPKPLRALEVTFAITPAFVPLSLLLSTTSAAALQKHYGLRCGGFVSSAYLGLLVLDPLAIAYVAVSALITCFVVRHAVSPFTILFGRRKFAAMQLVGGVVSWSGLWLGERLAATATVAAWCESVPAFVGIVLTGLLANDLERVGVVRVAQGTALSALTAMFGTLLLIECTESQRPEVLAVLAAGAAVCGLVVFGPGLASLWAPLWAPWWSPSGAEPGSAPRGTALRTPVAHVPALALAALAVLACLAPLSLFPGGTAAVLRSERSAGTGRQAEAGSGAITGGWGSAPLPAAVGHGVRAP